MNNNNPYIQYIEAHPELQKKFNQIWIERFYQNNRIQEYLVKFYVLKHDDTYIGIVESERPYSATYLYYFPCRYINLCCYIYRQDFAEPYINRDYSKEEKEELQHLINMKDKYGIERFHDEHLIPIKYRHYFKNEIKHTNIQEWSKDLENNIQRTTAKEKYNTNNTSLNNIFHILEEHFDFKSLISKLLKEEYCQKTDIKIQPKKKNKQKKATSKSKKSITPKYDPKTYFNKSIEEVGRLLSVNPFRLQTILNNRNKLGIESTKHILSAEEISLCKNTLTELYFIKIKDKKSGFQQ